MSVCVFVCLPICLLVYLHSLSIYLYICLPVRLSAKTVYCTVFCRLYCLYCSIIWLSHLSVGLSLFCLVYLSVCICLSSYLSGVFGGSLSALLAVCMNCYILYCLTATVRWLLYFIPPVYLHCRQGLQPYTGHTTVRWADLGNETSLFKIKIKI